jgi:integrase
MPRVATQLIPTKGGGFTARKRIPEDVQDEFERLYGVRWEVRLGIAPGTTIVQARALHREWTSEIESRIANIRASKKGEGQLLTPKDARALAGEWYHWFTDRHLEDAQPPTYWEDLRERVGDALRGELIFGDDDEVDEVWERSPEARENVRPMLADWGEVAQFLHTKRLVLDEPSRRLFLDHLYGDFAAALKLLIKRAQGNYEPDDYARRFPKFENSRDVGHSPWQLFELWVEAVKPAPTTVDRWRGVFLRLATDFTGRNAGSITLEEAQEWTDKLTNQERSPATVRDVWVVAARTLFTWAVKRRYVEQNPFKTVHVSVPRRKTSRPLKAFNADEIKVILRAAQAITDTATASDIARRWVPWLCAYTGARVGEIMQLRGLDVLEQDGVKVIRITPEAGSVKTGMGRIVPLHEHLIEQGFLAFVASRQNGPLFYNQSKVELPEGAATNPKKPRAARARERLAIWIRSLGISDKEVQPNHAWRHSFKQIAARNNISDGMSDYLTGHAPPTVARGYGAPTVPDMAAALKKFPRYEIN